MFEDAPDHIATGAESLREYAFNAGMDNPDCQWLLDSRDVWVKNPFYHGPDQGHPEDDFQHLDEGITPELLAKIIAHEARQYSLNNHEISEEEIPF
jgi:hypothetical protein